MKYRVTSLTPMLVGDGQKLAPIDYMVWKDHINVLDQGKIFRLLAKGPRLESYLEQLKKVDKLDFRSWGGFAQNFAGRRIAFEDPGSIPVWEKEPSYNLFIPTFVSGASGPYLPASAIKGALRTGAVFERWSDATLRDLAERTGLNQSETARLPRQATRKAEESALGAGAKDRMRALSAGDSAPVDYAGMRIHLLRTASLVVPKPIGRKPAVQSGGSGYQLGWKSARGTVDGARPGDATPVFAEMTAPGTQFEGSWQEQSAEDRAKLFQAANRYAVAQLAHHALYAQWTGLAGLGASIQGLEQQVNALAGRSDACLLSIGWGAGMLSKLAVSDTGSEEYRKIAKRVALYNNALKTGLPFPKTRRVVFESGEAAHLPGWVLLEVID